MIDQDEFATLFAAEPVAEQEAGSGEQWKILLVDDEPDIHAVLRLALQGIEVEGHPLLLLDALSAEAARTVLALHPDIALILLDVVMETERAGLELVHYIRRELGNRSIQIVLLTGQPGYAPERDVIIDYEIDGYRLKSELSADKVFVSVYAAVRTYRVMTELERQRRQLEAQTKSLRIQQLTLSRWGQVFEHAEWGIVVCGADGRQVELVNPAFARQHGYRPEEIVGQALTALFAPGEIARFENNIVQAHELGHFTFESTHLRKNGTMFPVLIDIAAVKDRQGQVMYRVINVQDITERKNSESQLRLAASVFANSREGIVITDADDVIVDVNPGFTGITGYSREEALGRNPRFLTSGRQKRSFYAEMWAYLKAHDFWRGEIWNRHKNGSVYAEMLSISVVRDDRGAVQYYIGVFSDISLLKAHEAELDRIAHYDALTGVANRLLLADRLGQAIARTRRSGKQLALCYLDLDGFKAVNDRHGHEAGDQLLIAVTERMQGVLRENDTIARLGGDEFVLLLSDLPHPKECYAVLDRILAEVRTPVIFDGVSYTVSASIGVTLSPPDAPDADALLRHADQAMYRAKEAGKDRYHLFEPALSTTAEHEL